jgi:hypothetical protein
MFHHKPPYLHEAFVNAGQHEMRRSSILLVRYLTHLAQTLPGLGKAVLQLEDLNL